MNVVVHQCELGFPIRETLMVRILSLPSPPFPSLLRISVVQKHPPFENWVCVSNKRKNIFHDWVCLLKRSVSCRCNHCTSPALSFQYSLEFYPIAHGNLKKNVLFFSPVVEHRIESTINGRGRWLQTHLFVFVIWGHIVGFISLVCVWRQSCINNFIAFANVLMASEQRESRIYE